MSGGYIAQAVSQPSFAETDPLVMWEPKTWQDRGNCVGVDPNLFFPHKGELTADAKAVCAGCVVREECLEYALAHCIKHGIWGGMSVRGRRALLRERRLGSVAS